MAKRPSLSPARGGPFRRTWSAFLGITLGRLLRWAFYLAVVAAVLAVAGFAVFILVPVNTIPAYEKVDAYAYLDQAGGSPPTHPIGRPTTTRRRALLCHKAH